MQHDWFTLLIGHRASESLSSLLLSNTWIVEIVSVRNTTVLLSDADDLDNMNESRNLCSIVCTVVFCRKMSRHSPLVDYTYVSYLKSFHVCRLFSNLERRIIKLELQPFCFVKSGEN